MTKTKAKKIALSWFTRECINPSMDQVDAFASALKYVERFADKNGLVSIMLLEEEG